MKKLSKTIKKDYTKLENEYSNRGYYGLFMKSGRVKLDTKRYKKFFKLPDNKIEHRKSVYYTPSRIHRHDYKMGIPNLEGHNFIYRDGSLEYLTKRKARKVIKDSMNIDIDVLSNKGGSL